MEDSVSAATTVSVSLVTVVTSAREVCDGFSSLINRIIKKQVVRKLKGLLTATRRQLEYSDRISVVTNEIDIDTQYL